MGCREESTIQKFAIQYNNVLFVAASIYATESSKTDRLHLKVGVSDYQLPALVIVAPKGAGSLVYNQLRPITEERLVPFFTRFLSAATSSQCQIDGWQSEVDYTQLELDNYTEYSNSMKERIYINRCCTRLQNQMHDFPDVH